MTEAEMMKQAELTREVEELIEERLESEGEVPQSWLVKETIDRHNDIHGEDVAFYRLCGYVAVAATVRHVLQERHKKESDGDRQEVLPGFKRLQRSYSVIRNDERRVVRLERMTIAEGRAKEVEQRAMAHGCIAHAEELRDYFDRKAQGAIAA